MMKRYASCVNYLPGVSALSIKTVNFKLTNCVIASSYVLVHCFNNMCLTSLALFDLTGILFGL